MNSEFFKMFDNKQKTTSNSMFAGLEVKHKAKNEDSTLKEEMLKTSPSTADSNLSKLNSFSLHKTNFSQTSEETHENNIEDTLSVKEFQKPKVTLSVKSTRSETKGEIVSKQSLEYQRRNIESSFISHTQKEPLKAYDLVKTELDSYYRQYIVLQSEQQILLVRKKEIQREIESEYEEIRIASNQLDELAKEEKYKEAEILDIRLKKLKELVLINKYIDINKRRRNQSITRWNKYNREQIIKLI